MKKKVLIPLLVGTAILSSAIGAFAQSQITMFFNGKDVTNTMEFKVIDGRTYLPLRSVAMLMSADVSWDANTKVINVKTGSYKEQKKEITSQNNKPTMSKAEFEQLNNGMTYEEAVKIIGSPGELMSESGSPGDKYHTVMYMWTGEGSLGANANLMFQNNKLINKAQFGLK